MRISIIIVLMMILSCQTQNNTKSKTEKTSENKVEIPKSTEVVTDQSDSEGSQQNVRWKCDEDVCLQFRNHDSSKKSFEIYMINAVPIFGFQCDLPGVDIISSSGGLLQENEYQTSNSASRILSFSMQAKPIPVGVGILTEIYYDNASDVVCMTEIIFAGIGGAKLSNNIPECMKLK